VARAAFHFGKRDPSGHGLLVLADAFFALTGMRTRIRTWCLGSDQGPFCGLIILVATVGKFGGSLWLHALTGLGWRKRGARHADEYAGADRTDFLNTGLISASSSPTLFAMMV